MLSLHIDITALIAQYGYWALFIGCIAEGETIILLGGIAVKKGLLHYGWTVLIAMMGGAFGDQMLFILGYLYIYNQSNNQILHQLATKQQIFRVRNMIFKRPILFIIGVRFMYGFRLIGPIIIGAAGLSPVKFFIFNIIGAILWSLIFVTLGYMGGNLILPWLYTFDQHMKYIFILITAIIMILIITHKWLWK